MDVEGCNCGLLYCIIPVTGKNDRRKTCQDILASGLTFEDTTDQAQLIATNLTAMIYKITMHNSPVNSSHKQSNYLRYVLMLGYKWHADIWQLFWNNVTATR
jgi:hypothetical protein